MTEKGQTFPGGKGSFVKFHFSEIWRGRGRTAQLRLRWRLMNFARQRPSRTSFAAATRVAISLTSGPSPWDVIFAFPTDVTARGASLHLFPGLWSLCSGVDSKNFACQCPLTWTHLVLCQFFLARKSSTGATTPSAIASIRGFQMTMTLLT